MEPPDPIPNSEVKQTHADDSVGFPHVKVGHRQAFILDSQPQAGFFFGLKFFNSSPYPDLNESLFSVVQFDFLTVVRTINKDA